jgi:hypothetical protein
MKNPENLSKNPVNPVQSRRHQPKFFPECKSPGKPMMASGIEVVTVVKAN